MAKFYGKIGYVTTDEKKPGIYVPSITERFYYGELTKNALRNQTSGQLNDNINVANEISIVADPFANENFFAMKYVEFAGAKWRITNVEVKYPRLILTIGGVYNAQS